MQQNTGMKPTMSLIVPLVLLMGLAAMPADAQVQRVIFVLRRVRRDQPLLGHQLPQSAPE